MPAPEPSVAELIRQKRISLKWSQSYLAKTLCVAAQRDTITRHYVSRWESGARIPGPFWLKHLATVLDIPLALLKEARRRTLLTKRGYRYASPVARQLDEDSDDHRFDRPELPKQRLICTKRYRFAKDQWIVRPSTPHESEALRMPKGAPVLHVIHVARADDGQVLEVSESAWPAQRLMIVDEYEIDQTPRAFDNPSQV